MHTATHVSIADQRASQIGFGSIVPLDCRATWMTRRVAKAMQRDPEAKSAMIAMRWQRGTWRFQTTRIGSIITVGVSGLVVGKGGLRRYS